jgi:hypothetical protein
MRKWLTAVICGLLVFAACGREGPATESTLATAEPLESPVATEEAKATSTPAATAAPATPAPAATSRATPAAGTTATSAPAARPQPGRVNVPKDGAYVYSYSGTQSDPFGGGQQRFNGELTNEITHSGNVLTTESTNSESPGRTTIKTRWSDTKVEMLSIKIESQGGDFSCEYNPPLLITKFPVRAETYPKQQMKGEGNACDGTLEITIERQEAAKDATGRSWNSWRVRVRTTVKSDQLTITQNDTRWVSPELGVEVRSTGSSKATFGAQSFTQNSTTALKSHP